MKKNEKDRVNALKSEQSNNQKMANSGTMVIVDFLYPPNSKRRQPLNRCLLISMIEYVRLNREKDQHDFGTILEILSSIMEDLSYGVNREQKLAGFREYFQIDPDRESLYKLAGMEPTKIDMPDYAWRAYNLFYNYSKIESQHYATACLMYDLIPFADMTFGGLYSAIMHGQKIQDVIAHQEKNAIYQDEHGVVLVNKVRRISDKLFSVSEVSKKSVFIAAVLDVLDSKIMNGGDFDLNFDIEEVKCRLMKVIGEHEWNCTINMYDRKFCNRFTWYAQITDASEALSDVAATVAERILVEEGGVEDLLVTA